MNIDLDNIKIHVLISAPLIRDAEFDADFYILPSNKLLLLANILSDINHLTAVSGPGWKVDWNTLSTLSLSRLNRNVTWLSMVRMVNAKRVDFLLAPFESSDDLSLMVEGLIFTPILGIRIGLKGNRHFTISRHRPSSKKIHDGLNKDIGILRENGTRQKPISNLIF